MGAGARTSTRTLKLPEPLDVALTFGPLVRGSHDPTSRIVGDEWWRAMNTPAGPVTFAVRADRSAATVSVRAWGPGQSWIVERAPGIVGLHDRWRDFEPRHAVVASLHRRMRGLRMVRLGAVLDLAVATTVEQRVTTLEARRSWRALVRRHGAPAPGPGPGLGPHDLSVAPSDDVLATLPDWEWRRIGVEERRSGTVRRLARDASGLERAATAGDAVVERWLHGVRGVGPWTAAHVMHYATGDADAVPVGDWHLPRHVGFALAGEARADDDRMLELLEPFRPHRARVWRLIVCGTPSPPRRAPRARIHDLMRAEANRGRR
ncbi:MAG TPA: DNA-3-methyladenine glycosylase 2 family protein [Acidimicrobiia bacterium]|nr:DNA-3-methyladenine glycosylase 2 family protein [Acidimicrobiia bacterium]